MYTEFDDATRCIVTNIETCMVHVWEYVLSCGNKDTIEQWLLDRYYHDTETYWFTSDEEHEESLRTIKEIFAEGEHPIRVFPINQNV